MSGQPSPRTMFPGDFAATLRLRHSIIQEIRRFFDTSGYTEVETPTQSTMPLHRHLHRCLPCRGISFSIDIAGISHEKAAALKP